MDRQEKSIAILSGQIRCFGVPLLSSLGPTPTSALCAASASLSCDSSVCCSLQEAACAWSQILLTNKSAIKFTHNTLGTQSDFFCCVLNAPPIGAHER